MIVRVRGCIELGRDQLAEHVDGLVTLGLAVHVADGFGLGVGGAVNGDIINRPGF